MFNHLLLVKSEFFTFQNVAVSTTALTRAGGNLSQKFASGELFFQSSIDSLASLSDNNLVVLVLSGDSFFLLFTLSGLGCSLLQGSGVVLFEPLLERSSVDLNNGALDQSVGTDQLVASSVVRDTNNTGLASDG
jgi:hypothetical protein